MKVRRVLAMYGIRSASLPLRDMTTLPGPLVEPDWLAAHLDAPDLRIVETTVFLDPPTRPGKPYDVRSGRAEWAAGHIPGSAFADLDGDLAEPHPTLHFTFPSAERFAAAMSALGVEDGTAVVVYDRNGMQWATRLWWMLRAYGFDAAGVLDGGWTAWTAAGGPVGTAPAPERTAAFTARPRPDLLASLDEVREASADGGACLLNALAPEVFRGEQNRYGRAGRIPGSVNVFAKSLLDPATGRLVPAGALRERLAGAGALRDGRVIAYCGGGISATLDAFALTLLGARDVALYDGSMSEWVADPALPLDRG
jgi:thiosulfate/3-mercaptopyruvate sulfurtransferase